MISNTDSIGTVISDQETPTFEIIRIKLKAGQDVKPGTLVRVPVSRNNIGSTLIGRIRSAHEQNPQENPESINVRDTLGMEANYPAEEDSTTIYRLAEVELIEELIGQTMQSPQTLPQPGSDIFIANDDEIVQTLGLVEDQSNGLRIGKTVSGTTTNIILKRESIQRHFFLCGTTGSGKSYAMGVIAEELMKHDLPVIFIDTQDEYSNLVQGLGGQVLTPGEDFNIRISSLTDRELIDLVPTDSELQQNIITAAFLELEDEIAGGTRNKFSIEDLVDRVQEVGPKLTNASNSVALASMRTEFLARHNIFGEGIGRANWPQTNDAMSFYQLQIFDFK